MAQQVLMNELLTLSNLRDWAKGLPEGSAAGEPESAEYCPLARFLDENTDRRWNVDEGKAIPRWNSCDEDIHAAYPLPTWANIIVGMVDALPGLHVKREQFLKILDQIAEE